MRFRIDNLIYSNLGARSNPSGPYHLSRERDIPTYTVITGAKSHGSTNPTTTLLTSQPKYKGHGVMVQQKSQ